MSVADELILLSCDILEYCFLREIKLLEKKQQRRQNWKRRLWQRDWISRRNKLGASSRLIQELAEEDPHSYRNIMRMNEDDFNGLLSILDPRLQRQDTQLRAAIPFKLKLEVTLRFLATGDSFASLSYLFRLPVSSISTFLPEMLEGIKKALSSSIKVSSIQKSMKYNHVFT